MSGPGGFAVGDAGDVGQVDEVGVDVVAVAGALVVEGVDASDDGVDVVVVVAAAVVDLGSVRQKHDDASNFVH